MILASLGMAGGGTFAWQASAYEDCPTTLEYNGLSYAVYEVTDEIVGEDEGAFGTERGCGCRGPWSDDVAVARVPGVDPRTALVTPAAAHVLYVAEGVTIDEIPGDIAELAAP